jgi:LIVCS family branched-chain amino acid:cation transporter
MINKNSLVYGFAVFSMFFGSGNLVFPLQIGAASGNFWVVGFWGLFLSGVVLPFLGLFVIKLYKGSYEKFFMEIGVIPGTIIAIFTLSLLGSFGVVPRCITVAHAGVGYLFPQISLLIFSLIFSIICYLSCIKDSFMISIIGKWMTPILLGFLALLIIVGINHAPNLDYRTLETIDVLGDAVFRGYQTMDLFAAFFFSSVIFKEIQGKIKEPISDFELLKIAIAPSLIGATLLGAIYMGFVYLGSHYANLTANVSPEMILPTIAAHILGEYAAFIIAIIIIFSCITTAIALNGIYARYICSKLKLSETGYYIILLITTLISFLVSLLDFKGIAAFLVPILQISYPALIVLTFCGIFFREYRMVKKIGFYGALLITIFYR